MPWVTRIGEACLLALCVAAFSAVPTALRTARSGGSFPEGLLVGAAVLLPILIVSLVLARAAGRGFRSVVGQTSPRTAVLGIALWIGLALSGLALLGAVLKATTHHRGLGGATFGVLAAVIVIAAAVVSHRLVSFGQRLVARGVRPWILAAVGALIGVLPLLVVAAPLARGASDESASAVRAAIVDGAIALVASALVASFDVSAYAGRLAGTWGVPLAAIVMIAGFARVESSPMLSRAMRSGGGLPATLLGALEAWTDRDHDGAGAHFGGSDCDEGDPARHAGAVEIPGDGIDQDCDGIDPPAARPPPSAGSALPVGTLHTAPVAVASHPAAKGPDIVLVTLDTVRADRTSAYGYAKDTTPTLAALARRGVLFARAYATGSDTQRALAPLVSGRRLSQTPHDHREWPTLSSEVDTLAERLKRAGYATAAVTSFTWLSAERGFAQGFDRFETAYAAAHPERGVTGPAAVEMAGRALAELSAEDKPIFLWVHLFDAHELYLEHAGIDFGRGRGGAYDGEVAFVDRQLGAIVEAVARGLRATRTAWIVHGSNGEQLGERRGHGRDLSEESIRVPLVIATPDAVPARYDGAAVSTLDIVLTVLALAAAPLDGVQGTSLLPAVGGDLSWHHGPVFAWTRRRAAVLDGPLKLLVFERKRRGATAYELFDVAADPSETNDLASDRPDDVSRLTKLIEGLDQG